MRLRWVSVGMFVVATGACSSASSSEDASTYTVIEEVQSGIGIEVLVSVGENVDTEAVFNQVLDRNDYASVTIICEGDEDRQYSAILYGRADGDDRDVVTRDPDRDC